MASIELQDSTIARLAARAAREGMTLEAYLTKLAESHPPESHQPLTGDELVQLLEAEASEESAYPGTYSRVDIYADHA